MEMTGLQRSEISFRRSGSSGLVWDDKFLTGELNRAQANEENGDQKAGEGSTAAAGSTMERSRSNRERPVAYKAMKVSSPTFDPPSPKVSGGCCAGIFGKSRLAQAHHHRRQKFGKRK